jgi:putative transposase
MPSTHTSLHIPIVFSTVPSVREYIRQQEKHHQKRTFQEEYREFLEKHGIEYDERYLW